jgi:gamma-glutamylaminecyclotransferase
LVFVYGTLKRGCGNHGVMVRAGGKLLGPGEVDGYACVDTPWYPYAVPRAGATIAGEVYAVANLGPLDRLEGYPSHYDRALADTRFGQAWIYFCDPAGVADHIAAYGFTKEWSQS